MFILYHILAVFLYPLIGNYISRKVSESFVLKWLRITIPVGVVFLCLSTFLGITFYYNLVDIVIIQISHLSLFVLGNLLINKHSTELILKLMANGAVVVLISMLNVYAYGPSETCGQRDYERIYELHDNQIVIATPWVFGLMDSGTGFILSKRVARVIEVQQGIYRRNIFVSNIDTLVPHLASDSFALSYEYNDECFREVISLNVFE